MKKLQLLLFLLLGSTVGFAQVQVCLGTDATVCQGQTVQISNCGGGSPGGGVYLNAPTNVPLGDDQWSGAINMGFTFNFYGQNYTQCLIGSNGIVSFNLANANGGCPWALGGGGTLPSAVNLAHTRNTSMIVHQDLNPGNANSGPVQYQTIGAAPNRKFVVLYNGVTMFSCTNSCAYIGLIFYETTNVIEMFIGDKGSCPNWNGGLAIQGTHNNPGTVAHITPGRNNTQWTANQDGRRWTPTAPNNTTNYTISQIPYQNINAPGGGLQWQNTLGQTFPYNNGVLQVNQVPPGVTGYFLTGTACGANVGAVSDTTWITRVSANASAAATTDYCNGGNGTATATPLLGSPTFTYLWTPSGQTTQTATNLVAGPYTVLVTDGNGCTKLVNVTVPNTDATFSGTTTVASCQGGADGTATATMTPALGTLTYLWDDPAAQTTQTAVGLTPGTYNCVVTSSSGCMGTVTVTVGSSSVNYNASSTVVSCPGGANGTATATMTPVVGTLSYLWDDPAAQTTETATGLSAGTYNCVVTSSIGCVGTVTVTVNELPPMIAQVALQDASCNSGSNGVMTVTVNGGTPNYSYSWDNSSSTLNYANDLAAGSHTVTITDINNCVITASGVINEPAPLAITMLTPDQTICPENSTMLSVNGTGGSTAYTFTWTENGSVIGTGTSITVDPATTNSVYCVTLSEACGSPTTDSCMTIVFPTPIVPAFVPDIAWSCEPGSFTFTNTSNNQNEIASLMLEYGDGNDGVFVYSAGVQPGAITHEYSGAGVYDLDVTVTSIYGCVYTATLEDIVEVIANPIADFNMSANPTTIFETTIVMQDKSSAGVASWEWSSPGSTPSSSILQNPVFKFPDGVVDQYPIQLIVTTPEGCTDTVDRILTVNSDILFFAPNAFTPDDDEYNQSWEFSVSGVDEYNFELLIFNRWGEIIWETHDVNSKWDGTYNGKIVPAGAYTWIARVKDMYSDNKKTFQGSMNVLR